MIITYYFYLHWITVLDYINIAPSIVKQKKNLNNIEVTVNIFIQHFIAQYGGGKKKKNKNTCLILTHHGNVCRYSRLYIFGLISLSVMLICTFFLLLNTYKNPMSNTKSTQVRQRWVSHCTELSLCIWFCFLPLRRHLSSNVYFLQVCQDGSRFQILSSGSAVSVCLLFGW